MIPLPRDDPIFPAVQASHEKRMTELLPDLVILGDTFFAGLDAEELVRSNPGIRSVNCAISGDKVPNMLWRVMNGFLDDIDPSVFLIQAGYEHIGIDSPLYVAWGIERLIAYLYRLFPGARIVVHGLPVDGSFFLIRRRS